jgi:hypothetical protein
VEDLGLSGSKMLDDGLAEIGLESLNWFNLVHVKRKLADSCEFDIESLLFIKCRKFLI